MARPRGFDEDEVLETALGVFWAKGFEGATLKDLEEATGLGRASLYGAFGGKRALFLRAVDRYLQRRSGPLLAALEHPESGREAIVGLFRALAAGTTPGAGRRGCLLTNCAVDLAAHDAEIGRAVGRNVADFERAFEAATRRAQAHGEIDPGRDPVRVARLLVVCLQGFMVLDRARPDPAWSADAAAAVDEALG